MTISGGTHRIGDRYWTSLLSYLDEGRPFVDVLENVEKTDSFDTHTSFLGLVTAIHESYHLMQDLSLGLCIWVQYNLDEYSFDVGRLLHEDGLNSFPLSDYIDEHKKSITNTLHSLIKEQKTIDDLIYTSKITDNIIEAEIRIRPSLEEGFKASFGLRGIDLLETHAAILAEFEISRIIKKHPNKFSNVILKDCESAYRVKMMPQCRKVLEIFENHIGRVMRFNTANSQHPLYPECLYAAELGFLLFLVETALHTAPLVPDLNDLSLFEDAVPTSRFLKLSGSVIPCIMREKDNGRPFNLSEDYLFGEFDYILKSFIDMCNQEAHVENISMGRFNNDENNISIKSVRKNTFLTSEDVTSKWLSYIAPFVNNELADGFGKYKQIKRAMELRSSKPRFMYNTGFMEFANIVGVHVVNDTGENMHVIPTHKNPKGNQLPVTASLIIRSSVSNRVFHKIADMLFRSGRMECPYFSEYSFLCEDKKEECKMIENLNDIPVCRARMIGKLYFSGAEKLINCKGKFENV